MPRDHNNKVIWYVVGGVAAGILGWAIGTRILSEQKPDWTRSLPTDHRWALKLLGFGPNDSPTREMIQNAFREAVWTAHPDRGGERDDAGQRIVELTQARKLLLA